MTGAWRIQGIVDASLGWSYSNTLGEGTQVKEGGKGKRIERVDHRARHSPAVLGGTSAATFSQNLQALRISHLMLLTVGVWTQLLSCGVVVERTHRVP